MNKLILGIVVFAALLLIPVGSQQAFAIGCESNAECNDGSMCTADTCLRALGVGTCVHTPTNIGDSCGDQSDTQCSDPNTCNTVGVCSSRNTPGKICDSGNECRLAGICGITDNCILGLPANGGDSCGDQSDTECSDPNICKLGFCAPNNELPTVTCDSGNECRTDGLCNGFGGCTTGLPANGGDSCGDQTDTECSDPNICKLGFCAPNNELPTVECTTASPNECQLEDGLCNGFGGCLGFPTNEGDSCGDQTDTECSDPNTCKLGFCAPNNEFLPISCDDGFECTTSTCLSGTGICSPIGPDDEGEPCGDQSDTDCSDPNICKLGLCIFNNEIPGTSCDDGPDSCNKQFCTVTGTCEGTLPANHLGAGVSCGDGSDTECTSPDTCDGSGTCESNDTPAATACGNGGTECTNQDTCDGSGTCDDNGFKPIATACGDGTNTICNNPDTCDGIGTCATNFEPDIAECRSESGVCDVADFCDGLGNCDPDAFEPAGTACSCNAGAGECDGNNNCIGFVTIVVGPEDGPACTKSDGHGIIPVVIYGSATLDVTLIDPTTLLLDGQPVKPKKNDALQVNIEDTNDDGFYDLEVKFEDNATYSTEDTMVEMIGMLFDGQQISGTADICVK